MELPKEEVHYEGTATSGADCAQRCQNAAQACAYASFVLFEGTNTWTTRYLGVD